jgi:hypothetical protein
MCSSARTRAGTPRPVPPRAAPSWPVSRARSTGGGRLALGAGCEPVAGAHLEPSGGKRRTEDTLSGLTDDVDWTGADLDLALPARVSLDASVQDERGGAAPTRTFHAGRVLRF